MWGTEEPYLSIKAWLAGAEIRMLKSVRIGHKFRSKAPYVTGVPNLVYNKIRAARTLFDPVLAEFLISKLPKNGDLNAALRMAEVEKADIDETAAYYRQLFQRDIYWMADKFKFTVPELPNRAATAQAVVPPSPPGAFVGVTPPGQS
jgi:hypothetical protein